MRRWLWPAYRVGRVDSWHRQASGVRPNRRQRTQEWKPGQDCQAVATARLLGQKPANIHDPTWAVVGTLGDSICYAGVPAKVDAVQRAMSERIVDKDLPARLMPPIYSGGISDGQRNGTPQMRYSLIGRETTNDGISLHLEGSDVRAVIAVVACDKPPVGTLAALLEHNASAVLLSDGSIRPGIDPVTGETIDIISCFQVAGDPDEAKRERYAQHACPGYGSCGGMFTYNTMQSFIATLGMEPVHMVSPAAEDERRLTEFPSQLVDCLQTMIDRDIRPRDIVTPASLRNATLVAVALGGSTNVLLHAPEIARAAGIDFWSQVMSQREFNDYSRSTPVLVDARPFGRYSMVDIDAIGGLQVVLKELLDGGVLDGDCLTCTGETLREQVERLDPPAPDGDVIRSLRAPFKPSGGLRLLAGNLAPERRRGDQGRRRRRRRRGRPVRRPGPGLRQRAGTVGRPGEPPEQFRDHDMVVIRYEGPRGAPGMPEMLDPTSRITALCRAREHHRRADDRCPLLRGLRRAGDRPRRRPRPPSAARSRWSRAATPSSWTSTPTAWSASSSTTRTPGKLGSARWRQAAEANGGTHPLVRPADGPPAPSHACHWPPPRCRAPACSTRRG